MNTTLKAIENHELGAGENRGTGGSVPIAACGKLLTHYVMTCLPLANRLKYVDDLNDDHGQRIGFYSHNIQRGRRISSAKAFLEPARLRSNLDIIAGATARRILFRLQSHTGSHTNFIGLGLLKSILQFQLFGRGCLSTGNCYSSTAMIPQSLQSLIPIG